VDEKSGSSIHPGLRVVIKCKKNKNGLLTGRVKEVLTSAHYHPKGIKVRLESGEIGRVKEIIKQLVKA
jgi:uncharacterized repeat protein (TIGR03833 family)